MGRLNTPVGLVLRPIRGSDKAIEARDLLHLPVISPEEDANIPFDHLDRAGWRIRWRSVWGIDTFFQCQRSFGRPIVKGR